MLWTKRAHQCTIFRLLGAVMMKLHPIHHVIFETIRSGFFKFCISVQCHEIYNSSVFFLAQTSYTFDKNSLSEWNLWTFEWLGENSPNSSFHIYLKPQVSFSLNFASLFNAMEKSLLYFFSYETLFDFLQKELTIVQNFRLPTA